MLKPNIYVRQRGRLSASQARALEENANNCLVDAGENIIDFKSLFGNPHAPTLEIGFGVGQALLQMASQNPEQNYLGIEVYLPGIGALMHQCHVQELNNVRLIRGDVNFVLQNNFAVESIAEINIFFPDPWPKRKHLKRRIIQKELISLLLSRLVAGGKVNMATDWQNYADWMLEQFNHAPGFRNVSPDNTFVERYAERPLTRFEARGIRLGHEVWDLCFQKPIQNTPQ